MRFIVLHSLLLSLILFPLYGEAAKGDERLKKLQERDREIRQLRKRMIATQMKVSLLQTEFNDSKVMSRKDLELIKGVNNDVTDISEEHLLKVEGILDQLKTNSDPSLIQKANQELAAAHKKLEEARKKAQVKITHGNVLKKLTSLSSQIGQLNNDTKQVAGELLTGEEGAEDKVNDISDRQHDTTGQLQSIAKRLEDLGQKEEAKAILELAEKSDNIANSIDAQDLTDAAEDQNELRDAINELVGDMGGQKTVDEGQLTENQQERNQIRELLTGLENQNENLTELSNENLDPEELTQNDQFNNLLSQQMNLGQQALGLDHPESAEHFERAKAALNRAQNQMYQGNIEEAIEENDQAIEALRKAEEAANNAVASETDELTDELNNLFDEAEALANEQRAIADAQEAAANNAANEADAERLRNNAERMRRAAENLENEGASQENSDDINQLASDINQQAESTGDEATDQAAQAQSDLAQKAKGLSEKFDQIRAQLEAAGQNADEAIAQAASEAEASRDENSNDEQNDSQEKPPGEPSDQVASAGKGAEQMQNKHGKGNAKEAGSWVRQMDEDSRKSFTADAFEKAPREYSDLSSSYYETLANFK